VDVVMEGHRVKALKVLGTEKGEISEEII